MRISITGHTKGLGKDIFEHLSKKYDINGYSRSEGWDIKNSDEIIKQIEDSDVFINNAYYKTYQSILFKKIFDKWKDKDKLIININSSIVIDGNSDSEYYLNKLTFKNIVKSELDENPNKIVRVVSLYPSTLSNNYLYKNLNRIDTKHIAQLIEWVINQPKEIELRDIVVYSTKKENEKKGLI